MSGRPSKYHFAHCAIHERKELVRWIQRGITNPEWIRVCSSAEHDILGKTTRARRNRNQLDLFAK